MKIVIHKSAAIGGSTDTEVLCKSGSIGRSDKRGALVRHSEITHEFKKRLEREMWRSATRFIR